MERIKIFLNPKINFKKIKSDYYISTPNFKDYLLEGISAEIFEYIVNGFDYQSIIFQLYNKYLIDKETIENDLKEFICKMYYNNLIYILNFPEELYEKIKNNLKKEKLLDFRNETFSIYEKGHKQNIPINVDFHVTYKCNLQCKHCYAENRKKCFNKDKSLTLSEIKDMLDQLDELGTFFIRITGGEPFYHPQIMDILSYGHKKNFAISIVTNGTLLNKNIIHQLKEIKLRELSFSIHGASNKTHDNFVGKLGSFTRLKENLLVCKLENIPIRLSWTVTKETVHEAEDIINLSKELQIPISISPRILPQIDGLLTPKQHRLTTKNFVEFIKKFNYKPIPVKCTLGTKMQINYDGTVQPCLFLNDIVGDLRKDRLETIWSNMLKNREIKYKNFLEEPEGCKLCRNKSYCHRCPGVSLIENGNPKTCSESAFWESNSYYLANNKQEV